MKKNSLLAESTILISSMILGGVVASAAPGPIPANYNSEGHVNFVPDDSVVPPVGPPVGPWEPGTNGPLSIDYASTLEFGENKITSADQVYNATPQDMEDGSTRPNWVQVTDVRGGEQGWGLQVKQNAQFESATGKTLNGAVIKFMNGNVDNQYSESAAPTTFTEGFELSPGGELQDVISAKAGEGAGTWVYQFGDDTTKGESITLSVPGKTTKYNEAYSTQLTWTLTDIPGNIVLEDLNAKLKEASNLKADDYTQESWTPFSEAVEAGKKVSNNPLATQSEVETALKDLTTAMTALVKADA